MPPAQTPAQQRFFGSALARKRAGEASEDDPEMTEAQLAESARKPKRSGKRGKRTLRKERRA